MNRSPLSLAIRYLELFFGDEDPESLTGIFAPDLRFSGPFFQFSSARDYIKALKESPPQDAHYDIIKTYADRKSACILYWFLKPGVRTRMCQHFETRKGLIVDIILIFDSQIFNKPSEDQFTTT